MGAREGVLVGLHIFVVEDDADARQILKMLLEHFGALTTVVTNAPEALRLMAHLAPDVVISDIALGRMDGLKFVRQAKQKGYGSPFIAISAKEFDAQELEAAGFAAYVPKPLNHRKLLDTILAVIRGR